MTAVSLALEDPNFRLEKEERGIHYTLVFEKYDASVEIKMNAPSLDVLIKP